MKFLDLRMYFECLRVTFLRFPGEKPAVGSSGIPGRSRRTSSLSPEMVMQQLQQLHLKRQLYLQQQQQLRSQRQQQQDSVSWDARYQIRL